MPRPYAAGAWRSPAAVSPGRALAFPAVAAAPAFPRASTPVPEAAGSLVPAPACRQEGGRSCADSARIRDRREAWAGRGRRRGRSWGRRRDDKLHGDDGRRARQRRRMRPVDDKREQHQRMHQRCRRHCQPGQPLSIVAGPDVTDKHFGRQSHRRSACLAFVHPTLLTRVPARDRAGAVQLIPAHRLVIIALARRVWLARTGFLPISAAPTAKTSSLCSPRSGARRRIGGRSPSKESGRPIRFISAPGTGSIMPMAAVCGSATTSSRS